MPIIKLKKSGVNLWEEYPDLDLIEEFKILRKEEGDERSSNILKAIYYIWDPKSDKRDSGFTESELIKDLNKNLIGDKNFKWAEYEGVKQAWLKYCMTKVDSLVKTYQDEIDAIHEFNTKWKWSKTDFADKSDSLKQEKILFADLSEVMKMFVAEQYEREEMEGGYQLSLNEEEMNVGE